MCDPVLTKQLTVFMENRQGRLAAVCGAVGKAGANILALSLADTADFGIIRLVVSDTDKAADALRKSGFSVAVNEILAVEVEDRPGGLAKVLGLLEAAGINVEYLYPFADKRAGVATVAFRFDDMGEALRALRHAGVPVVEPAQSPKP